MGAGDGEGEWDRLREQIGAVVEGLQRDARADVVFTIDKHGQLIAAAGAIDGEDTDLLAKRFQAVGAILLEDLTTKGQATDGKGPKLLDLRLIASRLVMATIAEKGMVGMVRLRAPDAARTIERLLVGPGPWDPDSGPGAPAAAVAARLPTITADELREVFS